MKTQIDNLVRGIRHDLARHPPSVPELSAIFQAIGADGLSYAIKQRTILACWFKDEALPPDVRDYAQQQQLATLPAF
jgi:hypothetical protein